MDFIADSFKKTMTMESDALREVCETMDMESFGKAVQMLLDCKGRVVTAGCGTSGTAARKVAHTLSCVECPALFLEPANAVHGALGVVQEGDVVILFSKGGNTTEIVGMLPACKVKKATIIGVTENPDSILAKESDLHLQVKVSHEPDRFDMLATSSILATLAVFDAVAICVMDRNGFTKEKFGVIHPGGAVGDRLLGRNGA